MTLSRSHDLWFLHLHQVKWVNCMNPKTLPVLYFYELLVLFASPILETNDSHVDNPHTNNRLSLPWTKRRELRWCCAQRPTVSSQRPFWGFGQAQLSTRVAAQSKWAREDPHPVCIAPGALVWHRFPHAHSHRGQGLCFLIKSSWVLLVQNGFFPPGFAHIVLYNWQII